MRVHAHTRTHTLSPARQELRRGEVPTSDGRTGARKRAEPQREDRSGAARSGVCGWPTAASLQRTGEFAVRRRFHQLREGGLLLPLTGCTSSIIQNLLRRDDVTPTKTVASLYFMSLKLGFFFL